MHITGWTRVPTQMSPRLSASAGTSAPSQFLPLAAPPAPFPDLTLSKHTQLLDEAGGDFPVVLSFPDDQLLDSSLLHLYAQHHRIALALPLLLFAPLVLLPNFDRLLGLVVRFEECFVSFPFHPLKHLLVVGNALLLDDLAHFPLHSPPQHPVYRILLSLDCLLPHLLLLVGVDLGVEGQFFSTFLVLDLHPVPVPALLHRPLPRHLVQYFRPPVARLRIMVVRSFLFAVPVLPGCVCPTTLLHLMAALLCQTPILPFTFTPTGGHRATSLRYHGRKGVVVGLVVHCLHLTQCFQSHIPEVRVFVPVVLVLGCVLRGTPQVQNGRSGQDKHSRCLPVAGDFTPQLGGQVVRGGLVGLADEAHFPEGTQELDVVDSEGEQFRRSNPGQFSQHSGGFSDELVVGELELPPLPPPVVLLEHFLLTTLSILPPLLKHALGLPFRLRLYSLSTSS